MFTFLALIQDDLELEDTAIPTRTEMKARSRQIVQLNTVNEDLIPVFDRRSKRESKRY